MSIFNVMFSSWRRLLAAFDVSSRQTLLESMCDAYRMEITLAASFIQHAHGMRYPQFHTELLRIASEMQASIPWLQEQILALGGRVPSYAPSTTPEGNSWECLRQDVDETRRECIRLLEWIHQAEREEPAIAVGLQHIREDKLRHREELRSMFMKSDPYATATTGLPQDQEEPRKQAWLEQQKNKWLDHEQAAWEAEGKQTPWAEWLGEQEFKWATELPHYNRKWAQRPAE